MTPKPYWKLPDIAKKHDLSRLLPFSENRTGHFETEKDAERRAIKIIESLTKARLDERSALALERMKDCLDGSYFCGKIACPKCSRYYRLWAGSEFLRIHENSEHIGSVVTVILSAIPVGELKSIDVAKVKSSMRQRIRRSIHSRLRIVGGIEFGYKEEEHSWVLHAHLLILGCQARDFKSLRAVLTKRTGLRNTKFQALNNAPAQLSYLVKFHTYHRPGTQSKSSRANVYPLPQEQLVELVAWWNKLEFSDLLFLYGIRRRGRKLILE
jgi:hypothetical protein